MASSPLLPAGLPLPRPTLLLPLLLLSLSVPWRLPLASGDQVISTSPRARDLVLRCRNDANWKHRTATVHQYQCGLNNTAIIPVGNIRLKCTNFKPIVSWNINPDCTVPSFVYPGQVYTFGYQTTDGQAKFTVVGNPYAQSSLRVKSPPKGSRLGLNCIGGVPPAFPSNNGVVFQYYCTVTNSGDSATAITIKTTNFSPLNYWNILLNGTLPRPVPAKGSSMFGFRTAPANITFSL